MLSKIGFYAKATALALTLAVSSLVGCGGGSFSSADSDAGVTPEVTPEATGGQSSVIGSQSSVRSTGGQTVVSSQSSVISQSTGGTSSVATSTSDAYLAGYDSGSYLGGTALPQGVTVGNCPANLVRTDCICVAGSVNSIPTFDGSCSENTLNSCISKSTCTNLSCPVYSYAWQCGVTTVKSSSIVASGGSSAVAATGGSSVVAATGGSSAVVATGGSSAVVVTGGSAAVSPTTYSVTYQNQVASTSIQPPGTCPSGQTVSACSCDISGMPGTLTSCNPTACQDENSKQYPQSTFTWTCV